MAEREIEILEIEVDIYWINLSEDKQQELINKGYDDQNVFDNVFPLTTIYIHAEVD